jgi:acyl-CoA synthetase (AMP-forming)/AMP-acid ligase II
MFPSPEFPKTLLILEAETNRPAVEACHFQENDATAASHLAKRLAQVAGRQPDAPAISTATQHWTYCELRAAMRRVASALHRCPNFSPGARVVLLLPNSVEYVAAFYGTLLAGGVAVPLPPDMEALAVERICESTEAVAAIVSPDLKRPALRVQEMPSVRVRLGGTAAPGQAISLAAMAGGGTDLAAIFFTAGSTGKPKGVMLSHLNLIENACSIQQYLGIHADDRPLCVLPFYHAFGNSVLQSHLLAGAHLILDGKALFPETVVAALARHSATSLSAVPDLVRLLLDRTSLGRTPLPSLRYMTVAGGSLRHELVLAIAGRIAPARFFVMYGQTEATARLAYVPPEYLGQLPAGCIGRAVPGVELEIVDESGSRVAPGDQGELRARGTNVMQGYWKDPEGTTERIRDEWLYTGDLAAMDAAGWIYHRGRRNAIVKIAGFRVHTGELEEFAVRRLSVGQAVAVPFEVPQVGTRLGLYVICPAAGFVTTAEMLSRCRAELPRQLVPHFIRLLDDFPLNAAMKIDRMLLSQIAEQEVTRARVGA